MSNNQYLSEIQIFVAIAEKGSFTAAADYLGSSRAHLSRQLGRLEAHLGTQLIQRTTRKLSLTAAGQSYFETCQQGLAQISRAEADILSTQNTMQGHIRLNSVGGILGEEILSVMLRDFQKIYPDICLEVDFSSERIDLIAQKMDVVLRMGDLSDSTLLARKIAMIDINIFAHPDYLAKYPTIHTPQDLIDHNCLIGSINPWHFHHIHQQEMDQPVRVSGNLVSRNGRLLLKAALAGQGIVRLPDIYCRDHVAQGQLQPVFAEWRPVSVPLYCLHGFTQYQPRIVSLLIDYLSQHFSQFT